MHMADALVSPAVGLSMGAISAAAIGISAVRVNKDEFTEKKIPLMGVAGAMVFAGQMINFTIPATGSSGHIGGGILLAGLLGGVPAFLSISAVLIIQCLFFADGGLLALGCNIFNMGVIPCLLIYPLIFKPLTRGINNPENNGGYKKLTAASIIAAITGLELGAFCVVFQTYLSGISALPFGIFASLMLPIHLAIGLVEGIVTAAILCFVYKTRPEIIAALYEDYAANNPVANTSRKGRLTENKLLIALAVLTVITGAALSLLASPNPDGLEWSVEKVSDAAIAADADAVHESAANAQAAAAFLPGYSFAADPDNPVGTSASGIIGAAVTFVLASASGLIITKVKKRKNPNKIMPAPH